MALIMAMRTKAAAFLARTARSATSAPARRSGAGAHPRQGTHWRSEPSAQCPKNVCFGWSETSA